MAQVKRKQKRKAEVAPVVASSRKPTSHSTEGRLSGAPTQKWQLQHAKAQFSEVFRRARTEGPQHVTKAGKEEVVILSKEEFERLAVRNEKKEDIVDFFRNSPLMGLDLNLEREDDYGRDIDL